MTGASARPQCATDLIAVNIRQHNIQYDQVRQYLFCLIQGIASTIGYIHVILQTGKVDLEHIGDVDIIFHYQKPGISHVSLLYRLFLKQFCFRMKAGVENIIVVWLRIYHTFGTV
jgi:hypothetical protein